MSYLSGLTAHRKILWFKVKRFTIFTFYIKKSWEKLKFCFIIIVWQSYICTWLFCTKRKRRKSENQYSGNQFYGHNYDHDEEEENGGIHSNGHNYNDGDDDDDDKYNSYPEGI